MPTKRIICLSHDGKITELSVDANLSVSSFSKKDLDNKYKLEYGNGTLERECDFDYNDKFVTIYACVNGDNKLLNKHELPPPIDNNNYYGDIFAIYHENEKLLDFNTDEYKTFYETAFRGFENLNSDNDTDNDNEDDEDDEDSDLDGFIVNDSEAETSDYHTSEDEDSDHNDDLDEDELLEQYDVYKHYVDSMRKSGKSATKSIQDKLKYLYDELKKRNIL
jgi:hypothetical protein